MLAKQISVFVENSKGRLAQITQILAENNVNIRALSIADTTSFGILRVIVEDAERTEKVLKDAGLTVSVTDVLSLQIEDKPGGLSRALNILSDHDIDVDYAYAFISKTTDKANVVLRVERDEEAVKLLKEAGFSA
ncbi:MAG: ACT domain-containing protein [Clostridia bacterium]|nr:ACT domain-containing protein [Clostridia bacterium]